ncbi:electron transfer flavoprotein subunit beta/FixA family protein [Lactiplantibacillus dongliensis]|uniref:Electron transfer flavoprotein small subunit n=1 Tax=Lactiplantibacillus dongliensis TaxID=2559919 RepID=A0ABW1R8G8_9LACO|nr:hypothetical protein [Lactiplantibacillus dongliensis]
MNSLVFIKGVIVPTTKPELDDQGQLTAETSGAILNPADKNAIEAALQLADGQNGTVTVASYGSADATEKALRAALALGATKAVTVNSDLLKAGADNNSAVGVILAEAAKKLGDFDVIFTGDQALDMPQGYVSASIANSLGLPYFDDVNALNVDGDQLSYVTLWEKGELTGKVQTPAVISVTEDINKPRLPSFKTKMVAKRAEIEAVTVDSITVIDQAVWDQLNSEAPTSRLAFIPEQKKQAVIYKLADDDQAVNKLVDQLQTQGIL